MIIGERKGNKEEIEKRTKTTGPPYNEIVPSMWHIVVRRGMLTLCYRCAIPPFVGHPYDSSIRGWY